MGSISTLIYTSALILCSTITSELQLSNFEVIKAGTTILALSSLLDLLILAIFCYRLKEDLQN